MSLHDAVWLAGLSLAASAWYGGGMFLILHEQPPAPVTSDRKED